MNAANEVIQEEMRTSCDIVLAVFDEREAAVYERWVVEWLQRLLRRHWVVVAALTEALLAEKELDGRRVKAIVAAASGVEPERLPRRRAVRKEQLAAAPAALTYTWEVGGPLS